MHSFVILFGIIERIDDFRILKDRLVLNGFINLDEILIYNTSAAYVEVSNFAIAHLSIG